MGELSRTLGFVVRKFDDSYSSCVEVKDLDGDVLFLGLNLSSYISSGDHFPECRRNCIYFTDDNMDFSYLDGVLQEEVLIWVSTTLMMGRLRDFLCRFTHPLENMCFGPNQFVWFQSPN
ncbi:hypothetical protein RHMOL_Rhmol10G0288900 [Rhododendron molle]|uniref:Uncharacterized protein n=1 Tax=Rhododendron molle TaxID=49168 RepID=A0ACC0M8D3_RHOML|nr:hypothetical protein RHMOL_Rhmol10G0288900 [Rhododendron molle]